MTVTYTASTTPSSEPVTVLDHVIEHIRARDIALDGQVRPAAILWTDPTGEWRPLIELMQTQVEELFVLGDYSPASRVGPAIWLRCIVDAALDEPKVPDGRVPIIYLPGVGRQQLRAGSECPDAWKPLVELMFRGALWLQPNGGDWTLTAFLTSPKVLGLDIARDRETVGALQRALPEVALTPVIQLAGRRLQADDFDRMLSDDVVRDILRWMGDPAGTRARLGENGWGAFRSRCRDELGFDPETEPDVVAGARLGKAEGPWAAVWRRFAEAPTSYHATPDLLRRSRPTHELPFERDRWPDLNDQDEATVRQVLTTLPQLSHADACATVARLEEQHGVRRTWVWSRLGQSPMAHVLEHLARLASGVHQAIGGGTASEFRDAYLDHGWVVDAATWEALAASPTLDEPMVARAVRHLVEPWLDASARNFQAVLDRERRSPALDQSLVTAENDTCIVFVDGLRFDLGRRLSDRLEASGCEVMLEARWAALPSVTATGKPAVTPVADVVSGAALGADFMPTVGEAKRAASATNLRAEMRARGYQLVPDESFEAPQSHPAHGWMEAGNVDALGHKLGLQVARQIPSELDRLADTIRGLLDAGWGAIRVVTDHGWLLLPGGLPKVELPMHLTESRWARCAVIAGESTAEVPRGAWHWNPQEWFATAPGIACFKASEEYAHGGLSPQECITPDLLVKRVTGTVAAGSITSVTWRGLRCFVEAESAGGHLVVDLRLKSPSGPSVVAAPKQLDADGSASLVLSDDEYEGAALVLVLINEAGDILASRPTTVGGDS